MRHAGHRCYHDGVGSLLRGGYNLAELSIDFKSCKSDREKINGIVIGWEPPSANLSLSLLAVRGATRSRTTPESTSRDINASRVRGGVKRVGQDSDSCKRTTSANNEHIMSEQLQSHAHVNSKRTL
jgi:hypothetical protein